MRHRAVALGVSALMGFGFLAEAEEAPLDLSGVTAVAITGEASRIRLTTAEGAPYHATLSARRDGWWWYSSWWFEGCPAPGSMRVEGDRLIIEVFRPGWFELFDCVVGIEANLPAGSSVAIDQEALDADLEGEFSSVAIAGKAADISLAGHADDVAVRGDALRLRVAFDTVRQDERLEVEADMLDAAFDFGRDVPVDYAVTAHASYVDAPRSSPGAFPFIRVTGDLVRMTIR